MKYERLVISGTIQEPVNGVPLIVPILICAGVWIVLVWGAIELL